ncbi:unnamed protein product, partial [Prorocentrum cordatum]
MAVQRLKEDIASFLADRKMMEGMLTKGVVTHADAAALVLRILGHEDAQGPLSKRGMREAIRKYAVALAASRDDAHNLRMEAGAFEVDLFPSVLSEFAKVHLSEQDMDDVYNMAKPPPRKPAKDVPAAHGVLAMADGSPAAAGPAPCIAYMQADQDALAVRLETRDEEVEALKAELKKTQRSRAFFIQKAERLEVQLYDANQHIAALTAAINFRPGRHVTLHGGYTLAVRRNVGHASTMATLAMMTGDGPGSIKDPNTVVSYEHRAAAAKVVRSAAFYDDAIGDLTDQLEVHLLKCDGTNAELIQRKKVHVSTVHSSLRCLSHAVSLNAGGPTPESVADAVESQCITGDLLAIEKDDGPETHAFMLTHLKSVHCPTWRERAAAPPENPFFASVYIFGVDAGPGNLGALKRIPEDLRGAPDRVMFSAVFCFMHQLHLIVKDLLDRTEGFDWGPLKEGKRYWGTVATVANVWRSCGAPTRIHQAAVDIPGGGIHVAHEFFGKIPGRPLRGRWGSVAGAEKLIMRAKTFIGAVFRRAFGKDEAGPPPLAKAKAKANAKGAAKAAAKKRPAKVGEDEEAAYRQQQGDWRGTAVQMTGDSMWLALVHISYIAKEPITTYLYSAQKKKAALLRRERGGLTSVNGDFAAKVRDLFRADWEQMRASGQCGARLYAFLLVWRSRLPHDTQDLEGANSVLQRMAKLAPNLHIPLASDRLRLKLGTPIAASDCVDLHPAIMGHIGKQGYQDRFQPHVVADMPAGADAPPPPALPRYDAAVRAAARYAHAAGPLMHDFVDTAFTFSEDAGGERVAFLMCWSYHSKVSCATGKLRPLEDGSQFFHLDRPARIVPLTEDIGEMAMIGKGKGKAGAHAVLAVRSGPLEWVSLDRAKFGDEAVIEVKPKPPKRDRHGRPLDDGLEDFIGAAMGDVMEDDEDEYAGPIGGGVGVDDELGAKPEDEELDDGGQ